MTTVTGADLVTEVKRFLGVPYVYGGTTPTGFDCSGLIQYAYGQLGVAGFPRTSEEQYASNWLTPVSAADLAPGDLIFSNWPGDNSSPGHVAVYAGGGTLIEAPKPGENVHQISYDSDYQSHTVGYRRYTGPQSGMSQSAIDALLKGVGAGAAGAVTDTAAAATGIEGLAASLTSFSDFVGALLLPSTWVRVLCGVLGLGCLGFGVHFLVQEAGSDG